MRERDLPVDASDSAPSARELGIPVEEIGEGVDYRVPAAGEPR
jgi:hypothetical protein